MEDQDRLDDLLRQAADLRVQSARVRAKAGCLPDRGLEAGPLSASRARRGRRSVQPQPIVHHGERDLSDGLAVGEGPRPQQGQGVTDTAVAAS